jgi:hypothetical protein
MTIVLQNQFNNLRVSEVGFEVELSFDGRPETLIVPFSALKGFFDPSVQFGLQFDVEPSGASDDSPVVVEESAPIRPDTKPAPTESPGEKVVSLDSFRKK